MKNRSYSILLLFIFSSFVVSAQKAVTKLPHDSVYFNRTGSTMWVLTNDALNKFVESKIQLNNCDSTRTLLQEQVGILNERGRICDSALDIRSREALMWHNKLDSNDVKLQNTEIDLSKETDRKKRWRCGAFASMGAALVFLATTIYFVVK